MKKHKSQQLNLISLVSLSAGLWLVYLLVLLVIDYLFYPQPVFPLLYYIFGGLAALLILGLAKWTRIQTWLGYAFVPLVIGLLSGVPVVLAQNLVTQQHLPGPASGPEAILLRTMPLLLMALILVVWEYGWRFSIVYSLGSALITLGLHLWSHPDEGLSIAPQLFVLLIQTITFLLVGYFVSVLAALLRKQNHSLTQANARLADHAATLEELTISRERNRMARELHDTLAHTLSALSVQLETAKAYQDVDPATTAAILDSSLAVTRSGLRDTRHVLKALRASPLEDMGLVLALRQLATETAERANLTLNLSVPTHIPVLLPAIEQCLYRVAQEAMANVVHHANARTMDVRLAFNGAIMLLISDDGQGFDPQETTHVGHFGILGMRERAQLVGGDLSVSSDSTKGTSIRLLIKDFNG